MEERRRTALYAAGAAACAAVAAYATSEWLRDKRFKEPGPALPLLGHLYRLDIKNLPWELERLRSTVRDTTMGMWLGRDYLVYVTTPELTHKVFAEHGDKSSGRSAEMPAELDMGNKGLVLNEGEPWDKNRKLILRELVGSRDKVRVVGEIFDELVRQVGEGAGTGGALPELGKLIHKTVARGITTMIFGFRISESLLEEILGHVDYIGQASFDYMMYVRIPFYKAFGFETVRRFEASCQQMVKIMDELVDFTI